MNAKKRRHDRRVKDALAAYGENTKLKLRIKKLESDLTRERATGVELLNRITGLKSRIDLQDRYHADETAGLHHGYRADIAALNQRIAELESDTTAGLLAAENRKLIMEITDLKQKLLETTTELESLRHAIGRDPSKVATRLRNKTKEIERLRRELNETKRELADERGARVFRRSG